MGSRSDECRLRAPLKVHRALIFEGGEKTNYAKMDAIKKKMQAMKLEKDNAMDRAEEEVRDLQKKMQQLESDLDVTQEKLMNANQRLEEKERALQNAEGEVAALNRRVASLEEDLEKSEERLLTATQSWTWQQPLVTILNVCAKYSRTKPCQMKPEWNPWKTNLKTPESLLRRPTKNTMTLPKNCKWLSPTSTAQKRGQTLVRPRSLSSKRS